VSISSNFLLLQIFAVPFLHVVFVTILKHFYDLAFRPS